MLLSPLLLCIFPTFNACSSTIRILPSSCISIPTGRMPAVLHVDIPDSYWLHLATVASTPIFYAVRLVSVAVRLAREIISRMR